MKYIEDEKLEYKDNLLKHLRAYNIRFTGIRDSSSKYLYAIENGKMVGAVYANYSWDWVSLGSIYYKDTKTLKKIVSEISLLYKNEAVGLKLYTEVKSRVEDFKSIGFDIGGVTEKTPRTPQYFYLKNTDCNIHSNEETEVIISNEKIDQYNSVLLSELERFEIGNHIKHIQEKNTMFVALDNDKFVGGVHGSITEDSMYIGWLAIDEAYRGNGIGKKLMSKIEEKAKELNVFSINLGTVEFQAEQFYSKLGYRIVFTKKNDPRGYDSYSMIKKL